MDVIIPTILFAYFLALPPYFILQLFFILVLFSASHGLEPKLFAQLAHSNPSKHALCTLSFCVGGVGATLVKMGSVSWSSSSTCTAIENYTDNGPNVHIDALHAVFTEKFLPGLPHVAKVSVSKQWSTHTGSYTDQYFSNTTCTYQLAYVCTIKRPSC